MSMSGFFQFVIGFVLGIIFFSAGIAGGAYLFLTKVAVNPSKPVFSEEKTTPTPVKSTDNSAQTTKSISAQTKTAETPIKEEKEEAKPEKLPTGAYRAKVTWSTGLSLRAEPDKNAERIGGIGYNSEIIILNTSEDDNWQRVRLPGSGQEGWIKAGNVEKIED